MDTLDLNTLRIAVTVMSLVLFIALMLHSFSRRRSPEHSAAAQLPFLAEEQPASQALTGEQK